MGGEVSDLGATIDRDPALRAEVVYYTRRFSDLLLSLSGLLVETGRVTAFAFFRDPRNEPYHTRFQDLLERYRIRSTAFGAREQPYDPSVFVEQVSPVALASLTGGPPKAIIHSARPRAGQ